MTDRVLGLKFSLAGELELAHTVVEKEVPAGEGPRVMATANTDHVVHLAENAALRQAYSHAWVITADGTPVYLYAKLRGMLLPGRVTGSDLCGRILDGVKPDVHRLFFVVGSDETSAGIRAEMIRRGFSDSSLCMRVPAHRFDTDKVYSADLARDIRRHRTTHLFFGLGSPKSEVWTDQHRVIIGDCYVLNFGAGLDFFAGTKMRAPIIFRRAGMEWAWRLALEPRRLFRRYLINSWRFLWIIGLDVASRDA